METKASVFFLRNEFGTRATAGNLLVVVASSGVMMTISHGVAVTNMGK